VYVGDLNGTLHALNAATGAVRCTFTLPSPGQFISSPVVKNVDGTGPTVFIGDSVSSRGHFWAITGAGNAAGGCRRKWMYDNWANNEHIGVWDSPALAKNSQGTWEVVFGTSDPDESVYALDAVNGSLLWRFQTAILGPDEDVGAGPTIDPPGTNGFADGAVYIDGKDGVEYALNLRTGTEIWSFTLGPGSGRSYGVSEAALIGTELVVCYDASVFALDARTGSQLWMATLSLQIFASPAVAGPSGQQVLFVGDRSGTEYGLTVQNGTQVFSAVTSTDLTATAAVAAGMLYFISGGTLYAYAPS
jgi:outer membrane protein assembly factor BamB